MQGCFGATIGKAKQAAKTEIEKIKVQRLIMLFYICFCVEPVCGWLLWLLSCSIVAFLEQY